jgi:hypothetical protein
MMVLKCTWQHPSSSRCCCQPGSATTPQVVWLKLLCPICSTLMACPHVFGHACAGSPVLSRDLSHLVGIERVHGCEDNTACVRANQKPQTPHTFINCSMHCIAEAI